MVCGVCVALLGCISLLSNFSMPEIREIISFFVHLLFLFSLIADDDPGAPSGPADGEKKRRRKEHSVTRSPFPWALRKIHADLTNKQFVTLNQLASKEDGLELPWQQRGLAGLSVEVTPELDLRRICKGRKTTGNSLATAYNDEECAYSVEDGSLAKSNEDDDPRGYLWPPGTTTLDGFNFEGRVTFHPRKLSFDFEAYNLEVIKSSIRLMIFFTDTVYRLILETILRFSSCRLQIGALHTSLRRHGVCLINRIPRRAKGLRLNRCDPFFFLSEGLQDLCAADSPP